MAKKEFLEKLALALAGQVSETVIEENIRYYDSYISGETEKGKNVRQVLDELGDPRLIARSIIEAHGGVNEMAGVYEDSTQSSRGAQEEEQYSGESGFRSFRFNGIWALLLVLTVIFLIFLVIGTVLGGIFLLIRPILIPLLLIWLVYVLFRGKRRY